MPAAFSARATVFCTIAATVLRRVDRRLRLLSGTPVGPIGEERQSAEDERRNYAREFGVRDVRAERADHDGTEHQRGDSSPARNQHTEAAENLQHADDVVSVRGI